jgi:hypothetical protein
MHIYTYIYIYIIVGFSYDTPARKYLKYKLKHFCTKKERCRRQASFYQPLTLCRPRKVQISDSSAIIYVLLRSLVVAPCELELVRICIEHLLFRVTCVPRNDSDISSSFFRAHYCFWHTSHPGPCHTSCSSTDAQDFMLSLYFG